MAQLPYTKFTFMEEVYFEKLTPEGGSTVKVGYYISLVKTLYVTNATK